MIEGNDGLALFHRRTVRKKLFDFEFAPLLWIQLMNDNIVGKEGGVDG